MVPLLCQSCEINGYIFKEGKCEGDSDCRSGWVCRNGDCKDGCATDDDCRTTQACRDGICIVKECSTVDDCCDGAFYINEDGPCMMDTECIAESHCHSGSCIVDEVSECPQTEPCGVIECNYRSGMCIYRRDKTNGEACDDQDVSTAGDMCMEGTCLGFATGFGDPCAASHDCKGESYCAFDSGGDGICRPALNVDGGGAPVRAVASDFHIELTENSFFPATSGSVVRLWSDESKSVVATFRGHTGDVTSLLYKRSGDGSYTVVSGGSDNQAILRVVSWGKQWSLPARGNVLSLGWNDSDAVIVADPQGFSIWSLPKNADESPELLQTVDLPDASVQPVAIYTDALLHPFMITFSDGRRSCSFPTLDLIDAFGSEVTTAVSPDRGFRDKIFFGDEDGIGALSACDDVEPVRFEGEFQGITCMSVAYTLGFGTSRFLYTGGDFGIVALERDEDYEDFYEPIRTVSSEPATALAAPTMGVVVAAQGNSLNRYSTKSGGYLGALTGHRGCVTDASAAYVGDDGSFRLVSVSEDGHGRMHMGHAPQADTRGPLGLTELTDDFSVSEHVLSVTMATRAGWMFTGSADGRLRKFKLSAYPYSYPYLSWAKKRHEDSITDIAISQDEQILASCSADGTILLWQASDARNLGDITGHEGPVWAVAWSADGGFLASAGEDGTLRLWNPADRSSRRVLTAEGDALRAVAIGPGDGLVAAAGNHGVVRMWNPTSGEIVKEIAAHDATVRALQFVGEDMLVTAAEDSNIRIWRISTGTMLREISDHNGPVTSLDWLPLHDMLVSTSCDISLRLWDIADLVE